MAHAIAEKDGAAIRGLFATPVAFRAITPRRYWEAEDPGGVCDIILGTWFGPEKTVTDIISIDSERVGDVEKVSYRMAVELGEGRSVVEQVAYYSEQDGHITQMRLVCSGFRPQNGSQNF